MLLLAAFFRGIVRALRVPQAKARGLAAFSWPSSVLRASEVLGGSGDLVSR